ncbi:NUDIX hydrolase YfcD [Endozoicomonas sp. 8E]|uniref:NUDIX hydrolase YfcD n=1 Tax=Endozoicomonas sp. 8E TaxID=3035692 RepID=UPI0029393413|nr:NUDIX hydrolase YfcD [Endozoicomonas sp. 8E]WOG29945.1 NUDIX hydrolase YfcD [Endozoicomonas sp. 8E]
MPSNPELQPASEKVIIVDESNRVLGALPRSQMREEKLCHRATYVFVFNSKGQLYVQERTLSKDIYPGYFEPATGGVVAEGESYDVAAVRELAEELGIENTPLESLFYFYFHNDDCSVWGRVYSCQYEGELRLQEEEVAGVIMESPEDILSNRFNRRYTPDSLVALERLMNLYGDSEISA